jgi:hypothetical protein
MKKMLGIFAVLMVLVLSCSSPSTTDEGTVNDSISTLSVDTTTVVVDSTITIAPIK